jgi:hypothetical protein
VRVWGLQHARVAHEAQHEVVQLAMVFLQHGTSKIKRLGFRA